MRIWTGGADRRGAGRPRQVERPRGWTKFHGVKGYLDHILKSGWLLVTGAMANLIRGSGVRLVTAKVSQRIFRCEEGCPRHLAPPPWFVTQPRNTWMPRA